MVTISLVYAFTSMVILLTAAIHLFLPASVTHKPIYIYTLLAFLVSLSLLLLMPVNEVPVFYYLRGFYMGDPSITATLFFSAYIIQRVWGKAIYQPAEKKIFNAAGGTGWIVFIPISSRYYPTCFIQAGISATDNVIYSVFYGTLFLV